MLHPSLQAHAPLRRSQKLSEIERPNRYCSLARVNKAGALHMMLLQADQDAMLVNRTTAAYQQWERAKFRDHQGMLTSDALRYSQ